jgi:hypothetical protein
MNSSSSIFLLIGILCFALAGILRHRARGVASYEPRKSYSIDRLRRRQRGGWRFIEQLAAVMGIISFIIQVAVWVYPFL